MNHLVWFFSLKHTGTHFTFEYLSRMGLAQERMDLKSGVVTDRPGHYCHLHIEEPNHLPVERFREHGGGKVFVTIRNPIDVHVSWLARYGIAESTTNALVYSFEKFERLVYELNPHIFRVDAPDRKAEVEALAKYLEVDYTYDYVDHMEHRGHRGGRHNFPDAYEYEVPDSIKRLALDYGYQPPTGENNANSYVCERDSVQRQYG